MYCIHCGSQVEAGSKFCPNCGAPIQSDSAAPTENRSSYGAAYSNQAQNTAPVQDVPQKKKKGNLLVRILVTVLVILLARGVGYLVGRSMAKSVNHTSSGSTYSAPSSGSSNTGTITVPKDLITLHTTVVLDEGNGLKDYMTLYYGSDSHILEGWNAEYVAEKNSGYTMEQIRSAGLERLFPGFAEINYYDEGDYLSFSAKMSDLRNTDRVQALADCELIEPFESGEEVLPLDADALIDSFKSYGWEITYDITRLHN